MAHRNICSWLRRDSCVEDKSLSVPLCASLPATKHMKLPRPLQFAVFCFHISCHGALVRHFSWMNTAGWSHGTPYETLAVLHHMHRARLPHTTQVRCHLTLFILSCSVGPAGWSHATPSSDFGCITSHAQSTVATYNTGAVSPDVVHLIVLCWALVFRSFRDWSH